MLRVESCWCGISLRIGTLIILLYHVAWPLTIQLIHYLLNAPDLVREKLKHRFGILYWGAIAVDVLFTILAFIAVILENPLLLIPFMVHIVLGLFLTAILLITVPFLIGEPVYKLLQESVFSPLIAEWIKAAIKVNYVDAINVSNAPTKAPPVLTVGAIVYFEVSTLSEFVLAFYFFIVVYSYYRELKEDRSGVRATGSPQNQAQPTVRPVNREPTKKPQPHGSLVFNSIV